MKQKRLYSLLIHILIVVLFINIYAIFIKSEYSLLNICDSLAIIGLIYMVIGLSKLVKSLGFFDMFIFGFKKFFEIIFPNKPKYIVGNYIEYMGVNRHKNTYLEFIIVGILSLSFSLIVLFFYH